MTQVIFLKFLYTLHVQCEPGKVISVGVLIYIYIMFVDKKIESYFSDQIIFSNIHGRTSHRIYSLSLSTHSSENLSLLSN